MKVYLLGTNKGVDSEELGVGRYFIGWNEELYRFPTFTQNYVWTKSETEGSPTDESIVFQTVQGLPIGVDVGISYHIDKTKVSLVFQKYRRGIEEITDIYLRNMVRDAFVQESSKLRADQVYGKGKIALVRDVQKYVSDQVKDIGIVIEKIYLIGEIRLPKGVVDSINTKIEATQKAIQRENEIREEEAKALKVIAKADGQAKSILKVAKAEAQANLIVAKSITPPLIQYESVKKWDGIMPQIWGGGALPLIDMKTKSK